MHSENAKAIQRDDSLQPSATPCRRWFLKILGAAGIGNVAFQRAMAQKAETTEAITADMVRDAEWIAGIELTDDQRKRTAATLQGVMQKRAQLWNVSVQYDTLPALRFDPEMFELPDAQRTQEKPAWLTAASPLKISAAADATQTDFLSIRQLGRMLREGSVTSVELAKRSIERLRKLDPKLKCVVAYTEESALQQAEAADAELASGKDRGPLHGIPWGAKDLMAVKGYSTTWGAPQFREQTFPENANVVTKLEKAGAVLVAKLSLGALAMGDKWFGGQTRNPWNTEQGSSGSSAGSAAAVAAGAVPFALGSETLGSILSPCKRCGVAGLRPTFGRVSRHGCMSLSWSMDKIGPIARHVDDCGIVLQHIHGSDVGDPTTVDRWFNWPMRADLSKVRIGRVEGAGLRPADKVLLETLESLGANIVSVTLPDELPEWAISLMLDAEAATVFHQFVVDNETEGLNTWPETFRKLHFLSAIDYLHAARLRSMLMKQMRQVFESVDAYVGGGDVGICNLTGHPTIVLPTMMTSSEHSQPSCATLTGRLHDEATLLAVAATAERKLEVTKIQPNL